MQILYIYSGLLCIKGQAFYLRAKLLYESDCPYATHRILQPLTNSFSHSQTHLVTQKITHYIIQWLAIQKQERLFLTYSTSNQVQRIQRFRSPSCRDMISSLPFPLTVVTYCSPRPHPRQTGFTPNIVRQGVVHKYIVQQYRICKHSALRLASEGQKTSSQFSQ